MFVNTAEGAESQGGSHLPRSHSRWGRSRAVWLPATLRRRAMLAHSSSFSPLPRRTSLPHSRPFTTSFAGLSSSTVGLFPPSGSQCRRANATPSSVLHLRLWVALQILLFHPIFYLPMRCPLPSCDNHGVSGDNTRYCTTRIPRGLIGVTVLDLVLNI